MSIRTIAKFFDDQMDLITKKLESDKFTSDTTSIIDSMLGKKCRISITIEKITEPTGDKVSMPVEPPQAVSMEYVAPTGLLDISQFKPGQDRGQDSIDAMLEEAEFLEQHQNIMRNS